MRPISLAAVAAILALAGAAPALAQGSPGGSVVSGKAAEAPRTKRAARTKREPTAGQMAARERQRKCGAEWKELKASNGTGGQKWPQFWSRCNARLKGNSA